MSASTQAGTSPASQFADPAWTAFPDDVSGVMTARALPSPAPITCQPWCEANNGHPDQRLREDQCCFGPEHRVPLSSEPNELPGNASTQQQYLSTYLMRPADDSASRVFIGYNESPGRAATLEEARKFAHAILELADIPAGRLGYGRV
ncbi:MAG: hypothetical protein ABI903_04880 [Actinomycetota bacterium]